MKSIALTQELLNHFQISEYYQANPGGQKTVFIVTIDNKNFALKIINVADERFEREVKICKEFASNNGIPNIERVEIFGSNTIILEQYIDGNDLSEILPEFFNNEEKVRKILTKVVKILIPIWEARYVHRDLKPQNIRIKSNSEPVVLDFGIARALNDDSITATGGQPLSWLFATPEQYFGKKDLITIYAYANWDSIIYLAQTDIDYITIGSYENLRNFDIKRYTENVSGGKSDGYYFSEKLLNMIRAADLTALSQYNLLDVIKNEKNIFSDIILKDGYSWNIHKPDVNKNYLLSINNLLLKISNIKDLNKRKDYVLSLIENANKSYDYLENKNIFLNNESSNYHLNSWKTYLLNS